MTAQPFVETNQKTDAGLQAAAECVLDALPDAVFIVDDKGLVRWANAAAEVLLRSSAEALRDRPFALLLRDPEQWEEQTSPEPLRDHTFELRRDDGGPVRVSVSAGPLPLVPDGDRHTVLYARDLGDRHEEEHALRARNAELEHCVHTLAHDLRSPLVALLGFSRLLRQDYDPVLDETGRHFVDRIQQAARTMEDLIHDLLELSRIERGGARSLVDPRAVLLQLQAELKPRLDAAGIRLELPDGPPLVYCDRTRLYQVFCNLIGNAIEHMGACDDPRIVVDIRDDGDHHRISVRDFGKGIDADHHERIFQVLQTVGAGQDGRRGTGIGLAIVRKIAEAHGGRIWVESRPGEGACFHLTLPRQS
jgi:PAS domain S-box-containing protein